MASMKRPQIKSGFAVVSTLLVTISSSTLVLTEQMTMKVNATSTPTRNKSESDGAVSGLLVFGALMLGVVILAFLVWVLRQNWKRKVESRVDPWESYKQTQAEIDILSMAVQEEPNIDSATSALSHMSENGCRAHDEKNLSEQGSTRTNDKLNPHMTQSPGIEPGPHWWEASALTTAPSLLP